LDDSTYAGLMQFSKKIAHAIEKAIPCKRVGMTVIGLEVPHVHVHLIPLHTMEDARFTSKKTLSKTDFENIAEAIKAEL
jgi:histidine triad (HIT) family protein